VPGLQAQCDWAYCGQHPDRAGRMISIYAFVMVLGFSRSLFVKFTTPMRLASVIERYDVNEYAASVKVYALEPSL